MAATWVVLSVLVTLVCCKHFYTRRMVQKMASEFFCGEPQPRAYKVSEFTSEALEFNQPFVVLKRCERAGCCTKTRPKCVAIAKENVTFSIGYIDYDGESKEFRLNDENHLKCECQKESFSIK